VITQDRVKSLFEYRHGELIWKIIPSRNVHIGDIAGHISSDGYCRIFIDNIPYLAHRLIFLYHHGYLPKYIDHKKGKSNKIGNLRECTGSQNQFNSKLSKANTSGVKGVRWNKAAKKWQAGIRVNSKYIYLGIFTDIKKAAEAVKSGRIKLHGDFVNHG